MDLDLSRLTDSFVYSFGIGESEIRYLCSLFCNTDSIVLDVGSHVGSTALAFSLIASRGTVHAFEPSPTIREALLRNINLNKITNIVIHPFGLSDKSGFARLTLAMEGNPGSAYCTETKTPEPDTIELRSLDEAFGSRNRIDFVKVDIEGYEYKAIIGATQVLARWKPVLVVEINEKALVNAGATKKQVLTLLEGFGYHVFYLDQGKFCKYNADDQNNRGIHNVVCVHPDRTEAFTVIEKEMSHGSDLLSTSRSLAAEDI
jgi:FkbM family methyltransferase